MNTPNMLVLLALLSSAAASCTDFAGNKCNGCLATNNVCYPGMPKKQCNMYPGFQFCEDTPRICCEALTAECLSCSEGITEEEYCAKNPDTVGCPKPCCYALTAECLSCAEGITEEEYCAEHPETIGCATPLKEGDVCKSGGVETGPGVDRFNDCPAGTSCVAESGFAIGGEVTYFCTATTPVPEPVLCCHAVIADCEACKAGVSGA
eukprot:TRINITY_DN336_c0_g1_i1.p2 TRINITY_DN336_c0_g1~~TRINITY_DN336_c0_g1_i1.p2  ORF type:complete len:207 (+),score=85.26 TRINITY_DN336_c0_g1_i1:45-665(+)